MDPSVQIGLKDLHYALLTSDSSTSTTYDTPVPIIGAINAKVSPAVNTAVLDADDHPSEVVTEIGDIAVELNTKNLPLSVQAALLGQTLEGGVLYKAKTDIPPFVAIGFKSIKANGKYRYIWYYKGKFAPHEQEYQTRKSGTPEFQTPTIKGVFMPRESDNRWQAKGDEDEPGFNAAATWFDAVYEATPPPALTVIVSPADKADNQLGTVKVTWTYSNAIQATFLKADNFYLLDKDGAPVEADLSINAASKIVTLTPKSDLLSGLYIATASGVVKDVYGQSAGNTITTFTVGA